jgi:hypothetical protein
VKVAPLSILPLEKLLSSAVTVWAISSLFVQVTVVPDFTLSVAGLKLILTILTELGAELFTVEVPVEVPVELLLQEALKPAIIRDKASKRRLIFIVLF